jgi:hypothetical protein
VLNTPVITVLAISTWNNLSTNGRTSNPNPSAYNSTNPLPTTSNTNRTATNPSIISPSADSWVIPLIIFLVIVLIIAAVWKLKHRGGKYRERQPFSDSVKENVLEKQRHRCADCNRILKVVDRHHRNGNRSNNRRSVALCPNCHAIKTRTHR